MIVGRSFHDHKAIMRITAHFSSLFRTLADIEKEALEVDEGTTIDQIAARDRVLSDGDQVRIFQLLAGG
jgi:hypothetical protein